MAWTRYKQAGFEIGNLSEIDLLISSISNSTTKAYTQVRSARVQNDQAGGFLLPSVAQLRCHFALNHNGAGSSTSSRYGYIFRWNSLGGTNGPNCVRVNSTYESLQLLIGDAVVQTASPYPAVLSSIDTWMSCDLVLKAGTTDGWVSFYLDGELVLHAEDVNTGAALTNLYMLGNNVGGASPWSSYAYFDDVYLDTSDGSEPDGAPEPRRFVYVGPTGDVGTPGWTPNSGATNYTQVDEIPPDNETTYVYADADGLVDVYNVATPTIPEGYSIAAVIPIAVARRSSSTELLKVGLSDGTNVLAGNAQELGAGYAPVSQRYETKPAGGSWTEADLTDIKIRIESDGTY